jgi:hypothetical protein
MEGRFLQVFPGGLEGLVAWRREMASRKASRMGWMRGSVVEGAVIGGARPVRVRRGSKDATAQGGRARFPGGLTALWT